MWGATPSRAIIYPITAISIHAPRVGSDRGCYRKCLRQFISIHAPRVGSDLSSEIQPSDKVDFNPRSPCGERLSSACVHAIVLSYFNPRSPCGERHFVSGTHSTGALFQSTLPVWGATGNGRHRIRRRRISIHAPRVGSDGFILARLGLGGYFNPRSPCGERHLYSPLCVMRSGFQSTLPVWGATKCHRKRCATDLISIHAPRVGSDRGGSGVPRPRRYFNPRSPCGEQAVQRCEISIHAPRVGSDHKSRL